MADGPILGDVKYVAFLRAVNVGGRFVKMERLREVVSALNYRDVRTYIQSGNLLFDSDKRKEVLETEIEERLSSELGFSVPAIVRPLTHVEEFVWRNPFKGVRVTEDVRLCVTFTSASLVGKVEDRYPSVKGDVELVEVTGSEVFTVMRLQDGRPPNYSMNSIEKKFGVQTTTRFFGMLEKLVIWARN